jgi:hypothetical protein
MRTRKYYKVWAYLFLFLFLTYIFYSLNTVIAR